MRKGSNFEYCKIVEEFLNEVEKAKDAGRLTNILKELEIPDMRMRAWLMYDSTPSLRDAAKILDKLGLEFLIFDKLEDND